MSEFLWNHFVMHMGEKRREYRSDMKSPAAPLERRDTCYMDSKSIAVSMIKQVSKDNSKNLYEFIFGRTAVERGGATCPSTGTRALTTASLWRKISTRYKFTNIIDKLTNFINF